MQHLEPLNTDELAFIERRYRTESQIYMRTMNVLLVIGALSPLVLCLILLAMKPAKSVSLSALYNIYFVGLLFMIFFVGLIAVISYQMKLSGYQKDRRQKKKIVEMTHVVQKKYMRLNNTYHFYLATPNKYTIEVAPYDFKKWLLGDEISIEYAAHSKEYFGYY